jgi:hypothetical protein
MTSWMICAAFCRHQQPPRHALTIEALHCQNMTLPDQPSLALRDTLCQRRRIHVPAVVLCRCRDGLAEDQLVVRDALLSCSCWMATPGRVEPESVMSDVQSVNAEYWL